MKNNYKFSIVCPVYNSGKFLSKTIDSVILQSYKNWELILIDDGSIDESVEICDNASNRDARIKVIHKKNNGQMNARIDGVKISCGDYILFLDSDDTIEPNALNVLFDKLNKYFNVDVVIFNAKTFKSSFDLKDKVLPSIIEENFVQEKNLIMKYLFGEYMFGYLWMFAFNKALLLKSIDCPSGYEHMRYTEDLAFIFKTMAFTNNILLIEEILYNYRLSDSSVTYNLTYKDRKDRFCVFDYVYSSQFLSSNDLSADVYNSIMWAIISYIEHSILLGQKNIFKESYHKIRSSILFTKYYNHFKPEGFYQKAVIKLIRYKMCFLLSFLVRVKNVK